MYLALVDKYGQIVASDDASSINVMINGVLNSQSNASGSTFPPFIDGSTQFQVQGGVAKISDVSFAATPGYNYSLSFASTAIDP